MLPETSYGIARRLAFICDVLSERARAHGDGPILVADIGSGTGEFLTIPLGEALGSAATIYAYEPDEQSFQRLLQGAGTQGHVQAVRDEDQLRSKSYDAVIVSEVLEHVEEPVAFLGRIRELLKESGILVVTVPNGYGIFEIDSLAFNILELIGVIPLLRWAKRGLSADRGRVRKIDRTDTLAVSPHVNFFTLGQLRAVLSDAGFVPGRIEGKHLAAGPFSDRIIGLHPRLLDLNVHLGTALPLTLVAGWMLVARRAEPDASCWAASRRTWSANLVHRAYSRTKRWLNLHLARRQQAKQAAERVTSRSTSTTWRD